MSAVSLHNSIYYRDTSDGRPFHSRNLSTVSSATLLTNTTHHSQPNEPLLPHNTNPQGSDYIHIVSRSTRAHSPPKREHDSQNNAAIGSEERGIRSILRRRPLRAMRWLKTGLDVVIGEASFHRAWALYNAVRYFLAFTIYQSTSGETVSLALGICSGLSFAFLTCAIAFSVFRPQLLRHGVSYNTLSTVYWCLTYASILLLFAPAAANFGLVFAWRNASDLQLRPRHRCYVDIDLVWSRSSERMCKTNTAAWGVWVTLASLRLAITSAVLLGYQVVLYKLSQTPDLLAKTFRGKHRVNPSDLFASPYDSALPGPPPATGVPFATATSPMVQSQATRFQSETSSLSSRTKFSNSTNQPKLSRSRSSGLSTDARATSEGNHLPAVPEGDGDISGYSTQFSSVMSQIDREVETALDFARSDGTPSLRSRNTVESPAGREDDSDEDMEDNPAYTQRRLNTNSHNDNDRNEDDDSDDEDDFYRGTSDPHPRPASTLGYNEFGQPYPPDLDIPMMNGYIRRMPTIESMGSREMGSSIAGSSLMSGRGYGENRGSVQSHQSNKRSSYGSRPPTRSAMRTSWTGSEMLAVPVPESEQEHSMSLGVQAERLSAMSALDGNGSARSSDFRARAREATEMGEMLDQMMNELVMGGARVGTDDSPTSDRPHSVFSREGDREVGLLDAMGRYSSSTNGSRSTETSFVTAKTGSAKSRDHSATPPISVSRASSKDS